MPALPVVELGQLKELLFKQFPDYMPTEFEPLWSRCIESINQWCKGLRQGKKQSTRLLLFIQYNNIITIIMMIKNSYDQLNTRNA